MERRKGELKACFDGGKCHVGTAVILNIPSSNGIKWTSMSYRKELKDPDLLYNMLKNLLAQIKVRSYLTETGAGDHAPFIKPLLCVFARLIQTPGPLWNQ